VIRIADLAGGIGLSMRGSVIDRLGAPENVGDALLGITECIVMFGVDKRVKGEWDERWLEMAIGLVSGVAHEHGIDLWRHIELKLAYNRTRPHKHGKAY
jgi:hypothetical protein